MTKKPLLNAFLFTLFSALFLVSCRSVESSIEYEEMEDKDHKLSFIGQGVLYGAGKEKIKESCVVIDNQEDWNKMMEKLNSGENNVTDNFERQGVNFEEEMILACFDKVRSTGGYTLEIAEAIETTENIEVQYCITPPQGSAITIMTQPYHIITIPASTKQVTFTKTED